MAGRGFSGLGSGLQKRDGTGNSNPLSYKQDQKRGEAPRWEKIGRTASFGGGFFFFFFNQKRACLSVLSRSFLVSVGFLWWTRGGVEAKKDKYHFGLGV